LPADLAELGETHAEEQADSVVRVVGKMLPWIHLGAVQNTFQLVGVVEVAVEDRQLQALEVGGELQKRKEIGEWRKEVRYANRN
jgi:hypothetical protein